MGSLIRLARRDDGEELIAGLRAEGFIKEQHQARPPARSSTTSRPFVEPTQVERFRFTREWMREQFQRINNPREPAYTVAIKLNLPPSYLLIHRTWLGGIGVMSQLEAEAPFRAILDRVPARLRGGRSGSRARYITCSPTSPCSRELERPGHGADDLEAERLPQVYGGGVGLDDRVELDAAVALVAVPLHDVLREPPADAPSAGLRGRP